ncbi:PTS transporter subunit EIIC [Amedibacillus sp. YH-ame6]
MNYEVLAVEIVAAVGGSENIQAVTHCATRLRFNLVDDTIVDHTQVEMIEGVMGVSNKGGQYQLIIGNTVSSYYEEVEKLIGSVQEEIVEEKKKGIQGIINAVFDVLSGTFVMFIPVLIAAGMISAVLAVLTSFEIVSAEDPTYLVFSGVQSAIFYFLPIFAGYAAGTKMKMNPFVGMALGAILCFSTFNGAENLSVFGFQIPTVTYSSTVFPIILGVCVMAFIERGLKRIIPDVLKSLVIPTITLLAGVLITLFLLGPIGSFMGNYLSDFITVISKHAGWLAPSLIALIYPIMVFTGMHYSLIPLVMTSFATIGFDPLLMVAGFVSNFAEAGVASATVFLEKDKVKKAETSAIAISALCGVTEPALFGITLRNKKNLIAVCVGGFLGALFAGVMSCKAFGFVGGLPSLPLFLDPKGGFFNLMMIIVSILISFAVTFVLSYILNRGKKNA